MWKPKWLGVICASIVTLLQIGHSGRKDMVARLDEAGAQHSQSPGRCRYRAGDESIMARCNTGAMFCFAQSQKNNEFGAPEAALVRGG